MEGEDSPPRKKKYKQYESDDQIPRRTMYRRLQEAVKAAAKNVENCTSASTSNEDSESTMLSTGAGGAGTSSVAGSEVSVSSALSSANDNSQGDMAAGTSGVAGTGLSPSELSSASDSSDGNMDTSVAAHLNENFSVDDEEVIECSNEKEDESMLGEGASDRGSSIHGSYEFSDVEEEENAEEDPEDPAEVVRFDRTMLNSRIQARTDISLGECVLMAMSLANRHNCTDVALKDLMSMCNVIIGQEALPATSHMLRNIFQTFFEKDVCYFVYCVDCGSCVGEVRRNEPERDVECMNERCGRTCRLTLSEGNFFVMLDVECQIQSLFNDNKLISDLMVERQKPYNNEDGILRDVQDGILYQKLFDQNDGLNRETDFTYNFHVDGAKMFNTTKHSLYPIQFIINELPPSLRFKNVILVGLWYGKGPVIETFVEPFVNIAKKLYEDGISWRRHDGSMLKSNFVPLIACADSVQRPQLQNHTQFNGYFGCSWCFHPGKVLPGKKTIKYPYIDCVLERTEETLLRDMRRAVNERQTVNGVKGASPLLLLPGFNHVWGYSMDYLHTVLIGSFSDMLTRILNDAKAPYYLGRPKTRTSLSARLKSIKPPTIIPHKPESFSEMGTWKASDYEALLLFIIPILHDVFQDVKYLIHLACLTEGITLLLQKEIPAKDLDTASNLLDTFVKDMETLYGPTAMTYNVHILIHYVQAVKMCGPLWSTSTFPFESRMFYYKKKVTASKGVAIQITERVIRATQLKALEKVVNPSEKVLHFVEHCDTSKKQRNQKCVEVVNALLFGKGRYKLLDPQEEDLLGDNNAVEYTKMITNGFVVCSKNYNRSEKRCNSFVKLKNDVIGEVEGIFLMDSPDGPECKCILRTIQKQPLKCGNIKFSHIWECTESDAINLLVIEPQDIKEPCVFIHFPHAQVEFFLVSRPHNFPYS